MPPHTDTDNDRPDEPAVPPSPPPQPDAPADPAPSEGQPDYGGN